MPAQIASSPDVLMLAVQARVIAFTGMPSERVVIDAREADDETLIAQAEQYVVLRVEDGAIEPNSVANSGRFGVIERLTFSSLLWTRVALDESTRGDVLLTDPSLGHLKQRHNLYDALIDFEPLDSNGNLLVSECIKPSRSLKPKRPADRPGWAWSLLVWTMPYELALTAVPPQQF